jgi:hypothetical protein
MSHKNHKRKLIIPAFFRAVKKDFLKERSCLLCHPALDLRLSFVLARVFFGVRMLSLTWRRRMKKLIILGLIVMAAYFIYKKYMADDMKTVKKNVRNVDLFQYKVNDKIE